jgi:hypothetical protein
VITVKMNVIDYITITCNIKKNVRLQITSDYMKKCNRLQLITITPCLDIATYQVNISKDVKKKSPDNLKFEQKIQVQGP